MLLENLLLFSIINAFIQDAHTGGIDDCTDNLIAGPKGVSNDKLSATSEAFGLSVSYSRLNSLRSWGAGINDQNQYIQVDFDNAKFIRAIQTQGRNIYWQYVKKYKMSFSNDNHVWRTYQSTSQIDFVLSANSDRDTIVTNNLATPIITKHLRLHPTDWHAHISLRFEVIGCTASEINRQKSWQLLPISISDLSDSLWNKSASDLGTCARFCFKEARCQSFVFNNEVNTCSAFDNEYFHGFRTFDIYGNRYYLRGTSFDTREKTDKDRGYTYAQNVVFKLYSNHMNFNMAIKKCNDDESRLLFVRNIAIMDFFQKTFWSEEDPLPEASPIFIGGSFKGGKWMYNEVEVPEELWADDSNINDNSLCMTLTRKGLRPKGCSINRRFLCGF